MRSLHIVMGSEVFLNPAAEEVAANQMTPESCDASLIGKMDFVSLAKLSGLR